MLLYSGFCLVLISSVANTTSVEAAKTTTSSKNQTQERVKKPKFPDRGIPTGRRRGGTSRSECPALDQSLTAIVPGQETANASAAGRSSSSGLESPLKTAESQSFLTKTLQEHPNFWLYIPQASGIATQGEFVLQDESDRDLYRAFFDLPDDSGILKIALPKAQNALEVGQKYHWYVKVFCRNEDSKAEYIFVDAWIERVAPTPEIERRLSASNSAEYQVYMDHNILHDAINYSARMKKNYPNGIREQNRWHQLLSNLGLADLIDKNILEIKANFREE